MEETDMADIRNSQNWSFETKQVHIGQEQPDPATGARAVRYISDRSSRIRQQGQEQFRSMHQHLSCLMTVSMRRTASL